MSTDEDLHPRTGRPYCGFEETDSGNPCEYPVIPGLDRCHVHLHAEEDDEL